MADEPMTEHEGLGSSRISRRSLIKAGAIVGGTVWVAPVIDSFVSRAAAASLLHYCCTCFGDTSTHNASPQCEQDNSPTSASACVAYCQFENSSRGTAFQSYVWCSGSSTAYTCNAIPFNGTSGVCSGGCAPKCCSSGSVPS
jgi:hypothetical protein